MKKIWQNCLIFFILTALHGGGKPPLSQPNKALRQLYPLHKTLLIDGRLNDWPRLPSLLINLSPQGSTISPSSDIQVEASLAYDPEFFYAALKVVDDTFEFSPRGWRYGDGFYLTFVRNAQGKADSQFYSYGFAATGKGLEKILVNRDGTYFPPTKTKDIKFALQKDQSTNIITYEVAIPWRYLAPFKPFIHRQLGINLIYVDRDGSERTILQLFPDLNYDTELSTKRKGAPFVCLVQPPEKEELEVQTAVSANHFLAGQTMSIDFGLNSRQSKLDCRLRTTLSQENSPLLEIEKEAHLHQGLNTVNLQLPLQGVKTGEYFVINEVYYQANKPPLKTKGKIFVLEERWLTGIKNNLAAWASGNYSNQQFQASLPAAQIRCQWIEEFMGSAPFHASLTQLVAWVKELDFLHRRLSQGKPALFPEPGIHRYAHRSRLDGTLQPYSFYRPPSFNPQKKSPLLVVLHGSGVDESGIIRYYAKIFPEWLILAPRARGLSDWYLGSSGEDVLECLAHARRLFSLGEAESFLLGFSMGGYGVWRIGLLHPEKFHGLIIISGDFQPPADKKDGNMIPYLHRARGKPILIIHGTEDKAIPISRIYPGLDRLRALKISFDYWEIQEAGHGNFKPEVWARVKTWLSQKLNPST